jgi:restriction endonuclease Mrr
MGYGGSLKDAGKAIGKSGDEALTESSRKINSG